MDRTFVSTRLKFLNPEMKLCRRSFLGTAAALPLWAYSGYAQARGGTAAPAGPQLPIGTTGLEHFGIVVPNVKKAGRFYGAIFNPELHKENSEPLNVSMGIGHTALGINRQPKRPRASTTTAPSSMATTRRPFSSSCRRKASRSLRAAEKIGDSTGIIEQNLSGAKYCGLKRGKYASKKIHCGNVYVRGGVAAVFWFFRTSVRSVQ